MGARILSTLAVFVLQTSASVQGGPAQELFALAPPATKDLPTLDLWATYYYDYPAVERKQGIPIRNRNGEPLTRGLSPTDWCRGAIEGTIRITTRSGSRVFNYAGQLANSQVDCSREGGSSETGRSYFALAKSPYGDGVAGFVLVPYRTIAVDKQVIPYGTVVFVAQARGAKVILPDGTQLMHDGYFFAADTGSQIKGTHIDVFCGATVKNCLPSIVRSKQRDRFKAVIVSDPGIRMALLRLHSPLVNAPVR